MDENGSKAIGRPTKYSTEIANTICEGISCGQTLAEVLEKVKIAQSAVFRWLDRHPEFKEAYTHARVRRAEEYIDELDRISRLPKEGEEMPSLSEIQLRRLRSDNLKFLAVKLSPKLYGDLVKSEHGAESSTVNIGCVVNVQINNGQDK